ncbi:hypothetical protein MPLDJ20_20196 [Mesorhizobium plurifarium]|uniref:Uncharacterized protein n=1 Tax=Mesorhizobium plurifarium TaxID=69974 RepID=A0A090EVD0_MESPL|nr:hypothetical protein MPLSOD_150078 [Mesorhizobium sp. SOD10]CDX35442.1 hypothetical protein MPLDJ20_20196 [Mesorhizobium plurifarium]
MPNARYTLRIMQVGLSYLTC